MNRIKLINSIFPYSGFNYESVDLPFLNMIYKQSTSKHITYINKTWFHYPRLLNGDMLYDLYSRHGKYEKPLYLYNNKM
jgi:hypothetical protein